MVSYKMSFEPDDIKVFELSCKPAINKKRWEAMTNEEKETVVNLISRFQRTLAVTKKQIQKSIK